jgi:hypothetical protein
MASTSDLKSTNTTKNKSLVSETGHNKNVANFSTAYQILKEMGSLYNPSNANIKLENLNPISVSLQSVIAEFNNKKPLYKNAVAAREVAIAPLSKLMTKSTNFAKSLNISAPDKENIVNQAKKIRGDQKPKKVNPDTSESESISTSQLSYDSRIANFDSYINQLASHPQYEPNEQEIQIQTFQALHSKLVSLSQTVNAAGNSLITARKNRNEILYNNEINVLQLMKDIKAYLKSLGDAGKPYYNAVVRLKFRN